MLTLLCLAVAQLPPMPPVRETAVLGKTETGWRVTYKGRQFEFTGESKAGAEAVMKAIVADVDGTPVAKAMPAPAVAQPARPACGWVLVNGQWVYRCPNQR